MPAAPEHEHSADPELIFIGGSDSLQLDEDGPVYHRGDAMPADLPDERRISLQAAGLRFMTRHHEPVLTPDGAPATMAAAEQIDPPPGGPAVVAAVEDQPKSDTTRASKRG